MLCRAATTTTTGADARGAKAAKRTAAIPTTSAGTSTTTAAPQLSPRAPLSPMAQPDTMQAATPPHSPGLVEDGGLAREMDVLTIQRDLRAEMERDHRAQMERQARDHRAQIEKKDRDYDDLERGMAARMQRQARDFYDLEEELKEKLENAKEEARIARRENERLRQRLAEEQRARRECEAELARLLEGAAGPAEDIQRPGTSQGLPQPNQPGAPGRMGPQGTIGSGGASPALAADPAEDLEPIHPQDILDRTHQADDSIASLDLANRTHQVDESASSAEESARRLNPEEATRNRLQMRLMSVEASVRYPRGHPEIAAAYVMEREEEPAREQFRTAAMDGNLEEVQRILRDHPDVLQAPDRDGMTALHRAAYNNHVDVCRWLLAAGANPEMLAAEARTVLHYAAFRANHEVVELLVRERASINACADGNLTPLHLAINQSEDRARVVETVKAILAAPGIDLKVTSNEGETPLMLAQRIVPEVTELIQARLSST
ncbi:ankyrin repeats (many copies) domain-containing protein [Ditylenchus destructor]|nr:ankyrin repeats (many copies) domain-containing protein [Ditylenchus destructor]